MIIMKGIRDIYKKGLCGILVMALLLYGTPVHAATETSINIAVSATTIDITVPLNFACAINPNVENGFTYADNIEITNNTKAPIVLTANGFRDDSNTFENDILPTGLPEGKTWENLNVSDTKKYFTIGLCANNPSQWVTYYPSDKVYAKNVQDAAIPLGVINPGNSVSFSLDASYGKAVKQDFSFTYKITWLAELYES